MTTSVEQPAWGEAIVEGSLDWSFLTRDDLPEVAELCAAIAYIDDPTQPRDLEGLQRDFDLPYAHPGNHAVVGRDRGGTIVAYAWNHITPSDEYLPHVWIEFGVHPAWRHHKIGLRLVGWAIERARVWYRHIRESRPTIGSLWVGLSRAMGVRGCRRTWSTTACFEPSAGSSMPTARWSISRCRWSSAGRHRDPPL